ncbi:DNRLRE domain-containing protein [bacterium]|nr:DNRLRE domain-containing protein [bacterium]
MHSSNAVKTAAAVLAALLLSQCTTTDKTMVGSDYFDRGERGSEQYMVLYPAASDTFYRDPGVGGAGSTLYLGAMDDLTTRTLFRWRPEDLPTAGTIDTARLSLFFYRTHGDTSNIPAPTVHKITGDWSEDDITWDNFESGNLLGEAVDLVDFKATSKGITITLPNDLMQSWIDSTTAADNYGICISYAAPDTGFILQFYSDEHDDYASRPGLWFHSWVDTLDISFTLTNSDDAFIADQPIAPESDRLWVSNCTAYRSHLYFDTDTLPDGASINLAMLTLTYDTLRSWPNSSTSFSLMALALDEPFHLPPDLATVLDPVSSALVTADSVLLNISEFVQSWSTDFIENNGLIVAGLYEDQNIGKRAIYSSTADALLKPKLEIYYSLPAGSRF